MGAPGSHRRQACALRCSLALAAILVPPSASADEEPIDPQKPQRHFTVERPAGVTGEDAAVIYERILEEMVAAYRLAAMPFTERYPEWRRFNTLPYRSAQHGERYINNYANDRAAAYGRFEASGPLPEGSILVKDSFAITADGGVFSGPLFVMEKMAEGFDPPARDWRYTMIMPDGSVFGVSRAQNSAAMAFCITCHATAGDDNDHLFYVPPDLRVRAEE